jgi:regulator of replication initiation timing
MKRLIIVLIMIAGSCFAQQKTEVEQVKIQLADYVIYANNLQVENVQLKDVLKKADEIVQAFVKCETKAQKDSVMKVYGIEKPAKENKDKK